MWPLNKATKSPQSGVPAKAGTHSSAAWSLGSWAPAFAGSSGHAGHGIVLVARTIRKRFYPLRFASGHGALVALASERARERCRGTSAAHRSRPLSAKRLLRRHGQLRCESHLQYLDRRGSARRRPARQRRGYYLRRSGHRTARAVRDAEPPASASAPLVSAGWLQRALQDVPRRRGAVERPQGAPADLPALLGTHELPAVRRDPVHMKAAR